MSDSRSENVGTRLAARCAARSLAAGLSALLFIASSSGTSAQIWSGWTAQAAASPATGTPGIPVTPTSARVGYPSQTPHPAVVRVISPERDGASLGSGTLVDVSASHGLVITNWHVVRDAAGNVIVSFPDGFQSPGYVIKTDKDWDLAAVAIWRPRVNPVPIATEAPRPGDLLTIAGYGPGPYRALSGRCTEYLSPGPGLPYEIVELRGAARHGDSGGPMFNSRGELAGVLFGEGGGDTSGSYCGRVRLFLSSIGGPGAPRLPATMLAAAPAVNSLPPTTTPPAADGLAPVPQWASVPWSAGNSTTAPTKRPARPLPVTAAIPASSLPKSPVAGEPSHAVSPPFDRPATSAGQPQVEPFTWEDFAGHTWGEQLKTILACAGVVLVLLQVVRWVA